MRAPSRPAPTTPLETLTGSLERITFHNEETHFTVAKLRLEKALGRKSAADLATIVGTLVAVEVGESLRCEGHWENTSDWGPQFRIASYTALTPETALGIEKYLASGPVH